MGEESATTSPAYGAAPARGWSGLRLGHRLRPRRPGVQPQRPRDLGRSARPLPGRAHRPLPRRVAAGHPCRRRRDRPRHRATTRRGPSSSATPEELRSVADRRRAADHQRSAVPPPRPTTAAPAVRPEQIEAWEPEVRRLCNELLDEIEAELVDGAGVVDASKAYTQNIPVNVIARMLGLPLEDAELFRGFVHDTLEKIDAPMEERRRGIRPARCLPRPAGARPHRQPARRPHLVPARRDDLRSAVEPRPRAWLDRAAAPRGHRHHVERHRLQPLAPGVAPRRSRPARRRRVAVADGDRGVAARVRPGHHGPPGGQGSRAQRMPAQGRRVGAAAVPRGQPRPGGVRPGRRGAHRPRGEPSRGIRPGHPPLPRLEPRPAGGHRRRRGVRQALPELRAVRPRCRPLERRPDPRPQGTAGGHELDTAPPRRLRCQRTAGSPVPGRVEQRGIWATEHRAERAPARDGRARATSVAHVVHSAASDSSSSSATSPSSTAATTTGHSSCSTVPSCIVARWLEVGQGQGEVDRLGAQLVAQVAVHRLAQRLARTGMAAACVAPCRRPGALRRRTAGQQDLSGVVDHVTGERQVQRCRRPVDGGLRRRPPVPPRVVEQHHERTATRRFGRRWGERHVEHAPTAGGRRRADRRAVSHGRRPRSTPRRTPAGDHPAAAGPRRPLLPGDGQLDGRRHPGAAGEHVVVVGLDARRGSRSTASRAVRDRTAPTTPGSIGDAGVGRAVQRPGALDLEAHQSPPRRRDPPRPGIGTEARAGPPRAGRRGPGRGPRRRRAGSW